MYNFDTTMLTTQLFLQIVSLILAVAGLLISIYRIHLKTNAERKLEFLMHNRESENINAIRRALKGNKSLQEKESLMLAVIMKQLTTGEKDAIMKSFNKKNSGDKRRYLEKLIEDSGSEKAYRPLLVNA